MTSADVIKAAFFKQTLDTISGASCFQFLFDRIKIASNTMLISMVPSSQTLPIDMAQVNALSMALERAHSTADKVKWVHSNHAKMLPPMLITAVGILKHEHEAVAKCLAASKAKAPDATDDTEVASGLFDMAVTVHQLRIPAHARVSYKMVAALYRAAQSREPVAYPIGDYHVNLLVTKGAEEQYEHMGKQYVARETTHKTVKITDDITLFEQMHLRKQTEVISGTWDVDDFATSKSKPKPSSEHVLPESRVPYVGEKGVAKAMNCFATPAGHEVEIEAMRAFRKRHPHISAGRVAATIDTWIQQHKADLRMQGYSADMAIFIACVKSPENYQASKAEAGARDAEAPPKDEGALRTGKRKGDADPETRLSSMQRALENKERQIANLKLGKGKGAPAFQSPPNGGVKPPFKRVPCPPDVCRDFNFKAGGCTRTGCSFKHVCCTCGKDHPHVGNH